MVSRGCVVRTLAVLVAAALAFAPHYFFSGRRSPTTRIRAARRRRDYAKHAFARRWGRARANRSASTALPTAGAGDATVAAAAAVTGGDNGGPTAVAAPSGCPADLRPYHVLLTASSSAVLTKSVTGF